MRPFAYERPESLQQAIEALASGARPLAGGTDLLTLMKADIQSPRRIFDIKRIPELDATIERRDGELRIGALATLAQIARDRDVAATYPALMQAAAEAASPQLRNVATIGGNLLQQPRCAYFRNRHLRCWRRGGDSCHARDGENRMHAMFGGAHCHAVHPSDPACALLALDAVVRVHGPHGAREVSLQDFLCLPSETHRAEVRLGEDELLVELRLPAAAGSSVHVKAMDRKAWAFALVSAAVSLRREDERLVDARVVLGGVAPVPWRRPAAERALVAGAAVDDVARLAVARAAPLAHNGYKVKLARALVKRALRELGVP